MAEISQGSNKVLVVGLTGILGSGKSRVASELERRGALIIDADLLSREVVLPGSDGLRAIEERFGQSVITEQGELDRKALASVVFSDPEALRDLESILHPRIADRVEERLRLNASRSAPQRIVVYVAPLLFESGLNLKRMDLVVAVQADRERCIERVMGRDRCTREAAERRLSAQMSNEEKVRRADLVIDNLGSEPELVAAAGRLYDVLAARLMGV